MLSACSSMPEPKVITVTVTKPLLPPQDYLQRCQLSERYAINTNLDLLNYIKRLEAAIDSCDASSIRLIDWAERMSTYRNDDQ
ncbi:Rz1-like lysis system protein LysC [Alishewanella sp. HL-SH06]|uniref:Rz1-like lysis system protein LysC n=1 Tax=Alishewanella sp. HL-SH06 TaxID=3461144 RepID=UPI0040424952